MHGSRWRGLETEHPVMVTAVKRPAGETRGKVAAGPDAGQCHRASPRPYSYFQLIILCSNCVRTSADLTMSPIVVGLRLTCWMARHRWDIKAKPGSPW
jgi:hypothetical protein